MRYDETQIIYWTRREREERELADHSVDGARAAHIRLADAYAILIAQAVDAAGSTLPE